MFKKVIKFAAYMLAGLNLGVASGLCPMLLAVLFAIGGNIRAAFAVNAGVCALIATAVFLVHCRHRSAEKQKPDYRASGAFAGFALGGGCGNNYRYKLGGFIGHGYYHRNMIKITGI